MAKTPRIKTASIEDLLNKPKKTTSNTSTSYQGLFQGKKQQQTKTLSKKELDHKEILQNRLKEIQTSDLEQQAKERAFLLGLPYINLNGFPISPEALTLIDKEIAQKQKIIAFFKIEGDIRLATTQKINENIKKIAKKIATDNLANVQIYYCSQQSIDFVFSLYEKLPKKIEQKYGFELDENKLKEMQKNVGNFKELQEKLEKSSTTDLVTLILGTGLKSDASDIHIEAEEKDIKIRLRIDGILHEAAIIPKDKWKLIISRIKLLAGMKINISSIPQDGRITLLLNNEKIEIRVSTLPTTYGESVVMRLLKAKSIALEFDKLGIRGLAWQRLQQEIKRPNGMIVTTGPTGSGKTTTLYAILRKLNTPEVKIITLEDPVEYKLEGINQSQVEHSKDYTFAKGLRSILRQDPDIVMVGEIRDFETAEIAVQASLTGHLVISTLHTNNAAGAIPRFLSMGVKPFFLAPALNCVIGQRLVRRLCPDCKRPIELEKTISNEVIKTLEQIPKINNIKIDLDNLQFYGPSDETKQCPTCNGLGYKGRIGVYEIFTMNKEIEHLVLNDTVSEYDMLSVAQKNGMITMTQDGLLKALEGITSVEEVFRVIGLDTNSE